MMKKIARTVSVYTLIVLAVLALFGCEEKKIPTNGERLSAAGISGEHKLNRFQERQSLWGSMTGSVSGFFFIGGGSIEGRLDGGDLLVFDWNPGEGEAVRTSLPYSKIKTIRDNTKDNPTVEFIFDDMWLGVRYLSPPNGFEKNPNLVVNKSFEYLVVAVVRISERTLAKEKFLPR